MPRRSAAPDARQGLSPRPGIHHPDASGGRPWPILTPLAPLPFARGKAAHINRADHAPRSEAKT